VFIYWKSIQEYAEAIYKWADETGRMNSVESLIDITNSEENKSQIFYKVPVEIIAKACEALERENKAEVNISNFI
jgi:hypothetical protein